MARQAALEAEVAQAIDALAERVEALADRVAGIDDGANGA
jgi:hypothetical protein